MRISDGSSDVCSSDLNTSNPYLAFAAMMLAGLDGINNRIEPPDPMDKDLYDLPPEELARVPQVPGSLEAALDALEADNDFLRAGDVFTDDLDRKSTRLNSSHSCASRMPSYA